MGKEWFDSWFDSPYYPLVYAHRDYDEAERFVKALLNFLQPGPGDRVLDLACGRGRHSLFLHSQNLKVVGMDLSEESIRDAKRAASHDLTGGPDFYVKDMRQPFGLGKFNLIFNLFTSFGYFSHSDENQQVFSNVKDALEPDGTFVLDFLNSKKAMREMIPHQTRDLGRGISAEFNKKIENGKVVKDILIRDGGKEFCFQERVQLLELADFQAFARRAGFKIENTWGDYEGNPFHEHNSPRLILFMKMVELA
ncbi:MAG: class I SAM-dependent methyltransferase [Bacteroidia bacterium]|nr:class I SAM-dependent methyltransferase [Bacteroidia bacterium]